MLGVVEEAKELRFLWENGLSPRDVLLARGLVLMEQAESSEDAAELWAVDQFFHVVAGVPWGIAQRPPAA